ncbi:MAG: hypothetical protein Q8J69_01215, partial [Sphingobacteriaceae bacterium]|nr:hypothetical protein [Sphingobacteriaceae bacterium]
EGLAFIHLFDSLFFESFKVKLLCCVHFLTDNQVYENLNLTQFNLHPLEKELSQLEHYSKEIGTAQTAASSVVSASSAFLKKIQIQLEQINMSMTEATDDFQSTVKETSRDFESQLVKVSNRFDKEVNSVVTSFDNASKKFNEEISKTKEQLTALSKNLEAAANRVDQLNTKLDSLEIPKHFEEIHAEQHQTLLNQRLIKRRQSAQMVLQVIAVVLLGFLIVLRIFPKLI